MCAAIADTAYYSEGLGNCSDSETSDAYLFDDYGIGYVDLLPSSSDKTKSKSKPASKKLSANAQANAANISKYDLEAIKNIDFSTISSSNVELILQRKKELEGEEAEILDSDSDSDDSDSSESDSDSSDYSSSDDSESESESDDDTVRYLSWFNADSDMANTSNDFDPNDFLIDDALARQDQEERRQQQLAAQVPTPLTAAPTAATTPTPVPTPLTVEVPRPSTPVVQPQPQPSSLVDTNKPAGPLSDDSNEEESEFVEIDDAVGSPESNQYVPTSPASPTSTLQIATPVVISPSLDEPVSPAGCSSHKRKDSPNSSSAATSRAPSPMPTVTVTETTTTTKRRRITPQKQLEQRRLQQQQQQQQKRQPTKKATASKTNTTTASKKRTPTKKTTTATSGSTLVDKNNLLHDPRFARSRNPNIGEIFQKEQVVRITYDEEDDEEIDII